MISISILAYLLKHIESIAHHEKIDKHIMLKGEKTGLWTFWHVNGTKFSEGHYDHDQQTGLWTVWYDNGIKGSEGYYDHDQQTGLWTFWHVNGTKFSEGHFDNHGQRIGLWTYWNDNGDIWTYFSIQRVSTDLQKISC